jgi:hypothetical protein
LAALADDTPIAGIHALQTGPPLDKMTTMNTLLNEIGEAIEGFASDTKTQPSAIIFPKPRWNDLSHLSRADILSAGIATQNEIDQFVKQVFEKGPKAYLGRKIFGLQIQFDDFGSAFTLA